MWYAQLTLLNKENIHDAVFLKKVNRWFLKTGISIYKPAELFQAAHRLYTIDYLYKKLQTNLELDLDSFFYLWFII